MSTSLPAVPPGNTKHPIPVIALSAGNLAESAAFYTAVFGWTVRSLSDDIMAVSTASGPTAALRRYGPGGGPAVVPFIQVPDVAAALAQVVAAGATVDRPPYDAPVAGRIARFADASGTVYGLTSANPPGATPQVPMPLAANPRPVVGTICNVELYSADVAATASLFHTVFGWGTIPTLPQYVAFDPGVGVAGVWQSHSPATPALPYIYVADVATTLATIEDRGGRRRGDALAVPGMATFGYFTDPSGTSVGLMGG